MKTVPVLNIASLTSEIAVSKDTLYDFLDVLERAEILRIARTKSTNVRAIKNSKVLFANPNIYFAIASRFWENDLARGTIRESFFASQAVVRNALFASAHLDFRLETGRVACDVEIGGPGKTGKQFSGAADEYMFRDGIEYGHGRRIPLYLAGLLY